MSVSSKYSIENPYYLHRTCIGKINRNCSVTRDVTDQGSQLVISNRWLWVRLNCVDVLKMERYPLFSFFLFLGQKLTIVEQSCTLKRHFSLTSCHVLTAKYSNYLLSYSAFFWNILLYKYSTEYVSWNNIYVFFETTIV